MTQRQIVPAGGGAGLRLARGEHVRLIDIEGGQTGDLMAFSRDGRERLSNGRTFDYDGKIHLTTGDVLWSDRSNAWIEVGATGARSGPQAGLAARGRPRRRGLTGEPLLFHLLSCIFCAMITPAPVPPRDPQPFIANLGLFFGVTGPFVILVLPFLSPRYGLHVSGVLRDNLLLGTVLWFVLGLALPVIALLRSRRSPDHGGAGRARIGLSVMVGGCLVAALAMPLPHARRWAAYAGGDIRTLLSAQAAYHGSINGAGYATLECLAHTDGCIPGYTGPTLLDPAFVTTTERHMHLFTFYPGPAVDAARARELNLPPTTIQRFAYVAIPWDREVSPHSLCGDDSGVVCSVEGDRLDAKGGRCPEGCTPFR
jgi:Domain of unknown function (DUF1989)